MKIQRIFLFAIQRYKAYTTYKSYTFIFFQKENPAKFICGVVLFYGGEICLSFAFIFFHDFFDNPSETSVVVPDMFFVF